MAESGLLGGPTGSGKTSLLYALLGEMDIVSGTVFLPKSTSTILESGNSNSIAYCSQSPWLMQASIEENILFGSEMDIKRFQDVLEACALLPDLAQLKDGAATEIGEKGVSLSGGQKARVALARVSFEFLPSSIS